MGRYDIVFASFCFTFALLMLTRTVNSQPSKPIFTARDEVDEDDLTCAACLAIVDIVEQQMAKKSFDGLESRLYDLMESVCEQGNFRSYDFIPPKMAGACRKFVDKNDDEELVLAFKSFYSVAKRSPRHRNLLERKICLNISGDCVGNKRLESKKEESRLGKDTPDQDKHFDATVDDLMKQHGHKVKKPTPVKHDDEL